MQRENAVGGGPEPLARDRTHIPLGLFSIGIGMAAGALAYRYGLGSLRDMGAGFFPFSVAVLLTTLGLVVLLRGGNDLPEDQQSVPAVAADLALGQLLRLGRVLAAVLGGLAIFALILESAGLAISTVVLVAMASLGHPGPRLVPVAALGLGLAIFACVVFVGLLGLQFHVWPELS